MDHGCGWRVRDRIPFRSAPAELAPPGIERTDRESAKGVKGILLLGELLQIGGVEGEVPQPEIVEPLQLARTERRLEASQAKEGLVSGRAGDRRGFAAEAAVPVCASIRSEISGKAEVLFSGNFVHRVKS